MGTDKGVLHPIMGHAHAVSIIDQPHNRVIRYGLLPLYCKSSRVLSANYADDLLEYSVTCS